MQNIDWSKLLDLKDTQNQIETELMWKAIRDLSQKVQEQEVLLLELVNTFSTDKARELVNDIKTKRNRV